MSLKNRLFTFLSRKKKVNEKPAPVTQQGKKPGEGIERPYDVKFGPDGAMYIVDCGVYRITLGRVRAYAKELQSEGDGSRGFGLCSFDGIWTEEVHGSPARDRFKINKT